MSEIATRMESASDGFCADHSLAAWTIKSQMINDDEEALKVQIKETHEEYTAFKEKLEEKRKEADDLSKEVEAEEVEIQGNMGVHEWPHACMHACCSLLHSLRHCIRPSTMSATSTFNTS